MTDLVLRNVHIVDVIAERILPGRTIEITDQVITGIGTEGSSLSLGATGAHAVNCSDAFVIPGLADMHVHLETIGEALLFVASGVTIVRNMDGSPLHLAMAQTFGRTAHIAPAVVTTSPIVDGLGPDGFPTVPYAVVAPAPEGAPRFVAELSERGYRQLKVYDQLSPEQHQALCSAARQVGMLVTGHCPRSLTFEAAIDHGQACFEHLSGVTRGRLSPARPADPPGDGTAAILAAARRIDYEAVATLGELMRERGVWLCPTTTVLRPAIPYEQAVATTIPAAYLTLAFRQRWRTPETAVVGGVRVPWSQYADALDEWHDALLRCLRILLAERVPVLAGTDYPTPGAVPGFALHEEVERLVRLGLTPWQSMRAATSNASRFLGEKDIGEVAVGRRADLVILDRDPTYDLSTLRRPRGVVVRGRHLDRDQLDLLLADRHDAASQADGRSRRSEVVGQMTNDWGEHPLERGTFRHRRVACQWIVTEHWVTAGQERERTVELLLAADGTIEHGQLRTTWGFASSSTTITRADPGYLVRCHQPDGVGEEFRLIGPLSPSERVSWSTFATWLSEARDDPAARRLWDGRDGVCTATFHRTAGRATILRATEVTQLAVSSPATGDVIVESRSEGGQNAYPRRLTFRGDLSERDTTDDPAYRQSRRGSHCNPQTKGRR